ncbi:uncharacterized protein F4812DRAFT_373896 [Daldinia caldariorum]|uniref:uncharacterized protein n=1 Tax=Daldinia caldariorum TaxID=326644 RepID=UPI002008C3D4|nr:uncharacterized protein F4812DRAFT_373896 [Daldinia caldariorum]KAI1468579.1 hypothetical protein F4812DRAFT_373896 [Daldinia caldariorum]
MTVETSISTPLPAGVKPSVVVALLHNHETYIRTTCPQLISYTRISPITTNTSTPTTTLTFDPNLDPNPNPSVAPVDESHIFEVTDRRPIGQTSYRLTLTNRADGIEATVEGKVPTGSMTIRSRWRVRGDAAGLLEEHIDVESNMITRKMVKSNIERNHPAHHRSFLAEAKEKSTKAVAVAATA